MSRRVIVGLSGGVDSAVAALKLRQDGYQVEGLFMFNWSADEAGRCAAAADYESAATVAHGLDIPLHRADFSREYKERVFADFLEEYAAGRTPNPDIWCNREIKFDRFLHHARRLGADAIATGHYARTARANGRTRLLRGVDVGKDQSYFLAAVPEAALARTLFPLGALHKTQVRATARAAGLPNHARADSTGICFIGERDFSGFLAQWLPRRPGPVRLRGGASDGCRVGEHQGLTFHTLGQRRGLGIGGVRGYGDQPWYVVAKEQGDNTLWVSQDPGHLLGRALTTAPAHWIGDAPRLPMDCQAQLRHRQSPQACRVETGHNHCLQVTFAAPQRAITPGQYVVFYTGEECLGGAGIKAAGIEAMAA